MPKKPIWFRPTVRLTAMLIVVIPVAGCTKDLVFATYTTVGVEVTGMDGIPTSVKLAYKRFEGAIIPVDPTDEDSPAHSVLATINTKQVGFGVHVNQVFATGEAARLAAEAEKNAALEGERGPMSNALSAAAEEIKKAKKPVEGGSNNG